MPIELIYGFAILKKAAAYTNAELGELEENKRNLIAQVCDEILEGKHDDQFPLVIWQTGSGTQSNRMSMKSLLIVVMYWQVKFWVKVRKHCTPMMM